MLSLPAMPLRRLPRLPMPIVLMLAPLASFIVAGCINVWPDHGQGGMAEYRMPEIGQKADEEKVLRNLFLADLVLADLDDRVGRLDKVRSAGALALAPASVRDADLLVVRIRRQAAGGLPGDAEADLRRLDMVIEEVEAVVRNGESLAGARGAEAPK